MRLPILIPYGSYIFMFLSYIFMLIFNFIRNSQYKYSKLKVLILTTFTMVFGVLGTIILFNIENPTLFFAFGTSLFGAIIFIPLFMLMAKLIYRKDTYLSILNFIAPSILVVVAIMRINCTLSGCCAGIESDFGITYGNVTRFPVQPMESILDILAFGLLCINERKKYLKVNNYLLLIIVYSVIRLFCEFFRNERKVFLNLSTGQIFSIVLLVIAITILTVRWLLKRKRASSISDN